MKILFDSRIHAFHEVIDAGGHVLETGHLALRCEVVHHARQKLAQSMACIVCAHASLLSNLGDLIVSEDVGHRLWGQRLIGAAADPGIGLCAVALVSELFDQGAQSSQTSRSCQSA